MRNQRVFLSEALDINDPRSVSDRINLYQKIIDQSHHKGEQDNAKDAMDKLIAKATQAGSYRKPQPTGASSTKSSSSSSYNRSNYSSSSNKPSGDSAKMSLKASLSRLANVPEKEIIRVEKVGNVIFALMLNMENTGYIVAKWIGKDFARPFEFTGPYSEANAKFLALVKKASATQDGFTRAQDKTNKSADAASGAFRVVFVGHFQDDTSDKIWGWGVKGDTIYQFWGRRGGKPSLKTLTKTESNLDAVNKLAKSKEAKGYRKTSVASFEDMIRKVLETDPKFKD